ncbi:hypothetical protein [Ensifer aridi]|uniref:hypothetical protein n=1 Tax=Ensifer aridi TaxID=1708715 RepID=UPI000A10AA50|nr:hypothetical protein [Ensifer aridi]
MLNWSRDIEHDRLSRNEFNIPENEVIIMFIDVGQLPETFNVAASPSLSSTDMLHSLKLRNRTTGER